MFVRTLNDLVRNSVEKYSDRVAFSMFKGESLTYKEVGQRVAMVKEMLLNAGLKSGDKVALLSSNTPNWNVCYFAAVTSGLVVVPILPDFTGSELDMIIKHSESKALMVSDKLYANLSKEVIDSLNIVIRTKNLTILAQRCDIRGEFREPTADDLAVIIYTSGTTSKPKGVMHTHFSITRQIQFCYDLFNVNEEDSCLSVLPLSHTYESSLGMLLPFSNGAQVTYLDRPPTATVLLPAFKSVRPTIMLIVPLIIEKIFNSQVMGKFNSMAATRSLLKFRPTRNLLYRMAGKKLMETFGGRLRFLGIGGAKLDSRVEVFLSVAKLPYGIGYGLTETAPMLAGAVPGKTRVGSTGPILDGIEMRLDNIDPETQQGEIVVKTPCAMLGYFKNEEATAEVMTEDGWFRTGDLGAVAADGYISIKGRLKNMIVGPSGENIYPEDIESVLNSHSYITESLVTEQEGRLVAIVHFDTTVLESMFESWKAELDSKMVSMEGKLAEWDARKAEIMSEVQEYVNSKVNRFSRISQVVEIETEFIRTPTQKIKRFIYNGCLINGVVPPSLLKKA